MMLYPDIIFLYWWQYIIPNMIIFEYYIIKPPLFSCLTYLCLVFIYLIFLQLVLKYLFIIISDHNTMKYMQYCLSMMQI